MNITTLPTVLLLLVSSPALWSQDLDDFIRRPGETAETYVSRVKPASETLAYPIFETDEWDAKTPSRLAFYQIPRDQENASEVVGHLYMKQDDVDYDRDIVFGTFVGEARYPEILDVFWKDLDKDGVKELLVPFRYFSRHYDFTGYIYDVALFDNPVIFYDSLEPLDLWGDTFVSFERILGPEDDPGPVYRTREEILAKLSELGY